MGLARAVLRMGEVHLSAHFTLHGMERLPYPDGLFGGVLSVQVIHHNRLEAIRGTVAEIDRVTRPGGLIWVTVPASKNEPSQKQEEIEPGTFIPLDGPEEGVPHHYFCREETAHLFPGCEVIDLHLDPFNHYSLLVRRPVSPSDENA